MATEIIFKKLYFYAIACVYTSEKHHRNNTQVCTLCEKNYTICCLRFWACAAAWKWGSLFYTFILSVSHVQRNWGYMLMFSNRNAFLSDTQTNDLNDNFV